MGWLGKIVGGALGFAIGGPIGAVAGATFGHAFDLNEEKVLSTEGVRLSGIEESQLAFFVASFSMLAKLAKVDGIISEEEIASVQHFMANDLNLSPEGQRIAIHVFQEAKRSPEPFENFAFQFYDRFRGNSQMLELMIDILLRVSLADGTLNAREEKLILEAVRIFKFSERAYIKLKARYVDDNEKYYSVLGCEPGDSDDMVKKQYRKLVFDYHPDTIASKGLPEEFTKFANDKFREIQEAYEGIKKERGL